MERRQFLASLGASFAAMPHMARNVARTDDRLRRLARDLGDTSGSSAFWARVREEFQLNPGLIHLNSATLGAAPLLAIDVVTAALRQIEGNPAGHVYGLGTQGMEAVRAQVAEFVGAGLEEVAPTRNTSEGMNAVAAELGLKPGDQVLTSNHEHGGGMVCWQYLRRRTAAFLHSGYGSYTASGGTRDVAGVLGLGAALAFHKIIGQKRIAERCRALSLYLRQGMIDSFLSVRFAFFCM